MVSARFYETRVAARKLLHETKEEYPIYLLAALLAAKKDGIEVDALCKCLRELKQDNLMHELGFDKDD